MGDVAPTIIDISPTRTNNRTVQGATASQLSTLTSDVASRASGGSTVTNGTNTAITPRKAVQPRNRVAGGGTNATTRTSAANDSRAGSATQSADQTTTQSKTGVWSGYGLVSAVTSFFAKLFSQNEDGSMASDSGQRQAGQTAYAQANQMTAASMTASSTTTYTSQGGLWPVLQTGSMIDLMA